MMRFAKIGLVGVVCGILMLGGKTVMSQHETPYRVIEGCYVEKERETPGVKLVDFVTTADTAVAIADAILRDGMDKEFVSGLVMSGVCYDPISEVWIIEYAPKELVLGGDISIAVCRKTGRILYKLSGE